MFETTQKKALSHATGFRIKHDPPVVEKLHTQQLGPHLKQDAVVQADPGEPGPLAPQDFFKIMQFARNFGLRALLGSKLRWPP